MKSKLATIAALAAMTFSVNAAISITNIHDDAYAAGWGNYLGLTVTFNDAALSVGYTSPDSAPLDASITLNKFEVLRSHTGGASDAGNVYLTILTGGMPGTGTVVATSTNTGDMNGNQSEAFVSFNFNEVALDSSETYYFVFTDAEGETVEARMRLTNNAANSYDGHAILTDGGAQGGGYYPVFDATFNIPEPSVALLGGLGLLGLLRRRRA